MKLRPCKETKRSEIQLECKGGGQEVVTKLQGSPERIQPC